MRRLDQLAQVRYGIPALILMEHAGLAVARAAARARRGGGPIVVLCSRGNNGGDGLVAARWLDNWGISVIVMMVGGVPRSRGPAQINWQIVRRLRLPVIHCRAARATLRHQAMVRRAAVVVDALLGTGARGLVREPIASAIEVINRAKRPVIAVDIPSGLDADTGTVCGVAVRATRTVTCGMLKQGLRRGQGREHAGTVTIADISLPRRIRR